MSDDIRLVASITKLFEMHFQENLLSLPKEKGNIFKC